MWNSKSSLGFYRSLFLLVRVRSGRFRLTLPLALFLLDETFEILADMVWLVEKFVPARFYKEFPYSGCDWKVTEFKMSMEQGTSPHQILELCRELLNELRRHGRYSLVEVEVGKGFHKQRVSVELF
jgi:hypothetical protein